MIEHDDGTVTLAEAELDSRLVEGMYAHSAATWEEVSKWLRDQAGSLFASGRDDEARLLRSLAPNAEQNAKEARAMQEAQRKKTEALALKEEVK